MLAFVVVSDALHLGDRHVAKGILSERVSLDGVEHSEIVGELLIELSAELAALCLEGLFGAVSVLSRDRLAFFRKYRLKDLKKCLAVLVFRAVELVLRDRQHAETLCLSNADELHLFLCRLSRDTLIRAVAHSAKLCLDRREGVGCENREVVCRLSELFKSRLPLCLVGDDALYLLDRALRSLLHSNRVRRCAEDDARGDGTTDVGIFGVETLGQRNHVAVVVVGHGVSGFDLFRVKRQVNIVLLSCAIFVAPYIMESVDSRGWCKNSFVKI